MRRMKYNLLLTFILICTWANAQKLSLGFQSGIGFYDSKDLSNLTQQVYENLSIDARIISNYPPYLYYKPSVLLAYENFNIGLQAAYYSTGSRISSKDYSGEYLFDSRINCIAPGLYIDVHILSLFKKYGLWFFADGGLTFSRMRLQEYLTVNNQNIENISYKFKSENYYIEPGLKMDFNIYKSLFIELNTSYFAQLGKQVFETEAREFLNNGRETIGPDWNGLRIGISVIFKTPFLKAPRS
jgi:hypothetical protein